LALVLLVAAALRLINVDAHALWFDEGLSLHHALGSTWGLPFAPGRTPFSSAQVWADNTLANVALSANSNDGGNGILYYLLLHGWTAMFGTADFAVRMPSVLFGVVTVWLVYRFGREWLGKNIAWWAAAGAAVSPQLIRYSQETRSYMVATCLGLIATWCFIRTLQAKRFGPACIGYGVATGLALLSHYLIVGLLVAHVAFAMLRCRRLQSWLQLAASGVIAGGLVLAWLQLGGWHGLANMSTRAHLFEVESRTLPPEKTIAWPSTPQSVTTGMMQMINAATGNNMEGSGFRVRQTIPWLVVPVGLAIAAWRRRPREGQGDMLLLVSLLAVSGVGLSTWMAVRSGHIVSFQQRFATFSTPYMVMLLAAGLVALKETPWLQRTTLAISVPMVLWSVQLVYEDAPACRAANQMPQRVARLMQVAHAGDLVVYSNWSDARIWNCYIPKQAPFLQACWEDPQRIHPIVRVYRQGRLIAALPSPCQI
jgi:4-amino-4-deoxy-L-arabinose transferase-like glycosyltransferase